MNTKDLLKEYINNFTEEAFKKINEEKKAKDKNSEEDKEYANKYKEIQNRLGGKNKVSGLNASDIFTIAFKDSMKDNDTQRSLNFKKLHREVDKNTGYQYKFTPDEINKIIAAIDSVS